MGQSASGVDGALSYMQEQLAVVFSLAWPAGRPVGWSVGRCQGGYYYGRRRRLCYRRCARSVFDCHPRSPVPRIRGGGASICLSKRPGGRAGGPRAGPGECCWTRPRDGATLAPLSHSQSHSRSLAPHADVQSIDARRISSFHGSSFISPSRLPQSGTATNFRSL